MSGVNLDALSDEQWDEWIAGCRVLRTLRDRQASTDQLTVSATPKAAPQSSEKNSTKVNNSSSQRQPVKEHSPNRD
jgi:hypothetical protein